METKKRLFELIFEMLVKIPADHLVYFILVVAPDNGKFHLITMLGILLLMVDRDSLRFNDIPFMKRNGKINGGSGEFPC